MPAGVKKYGEERKRRRKLLAGGIRRFDLYRRPPDFFLFSRREFCGILQEVPRRTRPMQRLIPIGRIAALPAWLDRGSEWTSSARFR